MDSIDAAILRLVQNDATLSLDDIASAVGASKTPVWNRLKRLKEKALFDAKSRSWILTK
jgi:Lrp/AsnC family transcriptional regulator